jgi:Protein of unknown function (DUF1800)
MPVISEDRPFYPPNVKGWDDGKSWINTATLTYRYELARELVYGILPEQVGLPKGPSATPPLNKAIAVESSMAETTLQALGNDPGSMRLANAQNTRNPAQSRGHTSPYSRTNSFKDSRTTGNSSPRANSTATFDRWFTHRTNRHGR